MEDFYAKAQEAVRDIDAFVHKHGLAGKVRADHICYKCGSTESFESLRRWLEGESEYVYQSVISKRRIAIVKFKNPVTSSIGDIYFLELSDQKPDQSQTDGFDHVELYPVSGTYEQLVEQLQQAGETVTKIVRPHHTTEPALKALPSGFLARLCTEPLVDKIKREEMH